MRFYRLALRSVRAIAPALALLSLLTPSAPAQFTPEWTAKVGNRNTSGFAVEGRELAPDGHLWIVALAFRKNPDGPYFDTRSLILLRFDPYGQLTWSINLADDTPYSNLRGALRVDDEGGAYVVVRRSLTRTLSRYSPSGVEVWRRHLDLDWDFLGETQLALDGEGGVVVAGNTANVSPVDRDLQLARYDADGTLRWQTSFAGPQQGLDSARDVAVDRQGRVHLTAVSTLTQNDPGTVLLSLAFDDGGRWLWTSELRASPDEVYYVHATEVQPDGTRTVALGVHDPDLMWWSQTAFMIHRVGPDGERLWTVVEPNQPLKSRECKQLRTAPWGDLIVAGATAKYSSPTTYHVNLKALAEAYSSAGEKRWGHTAATKCQDTQFLEVLFLESNERVALITNMGSQPNCYPLISFTLEFLSAQGALLDAQRIELPGAGTS